MTERLLSAAEVAELLAVPESWVREHTRNGSLPRIQLGRYVRYRPEAIVSWLESQEGANAECRKEVAKPHVQSVRSRATAAAATGTQEAA